MDSVFSSLDEDVVDAEFFDLASATSPLAGGLGLARPAWQREISTAPAATSYVPSLFPAATPVEPIPGKLPPFVLAKRVGFFVGPLSIFTVIPEKGNQCFRPSATKLGRPYGVMYVLSWWTP